jgi:DNA mismatch repair protein MutL
MSTAPAPRIRVLPPALADQIAAGEVVERPASVVKELCENALDAEARRIEVEIEAGGRRLVRVVDDGCGMTAEEARLALGRHATSKIASADDLWGLLTFGFRGEALPSIAAVSRLTVRTRMAASPGGFRLVVEAGSETDAGEVGMAPGTQLEVRDLFFNTPARLKFLKAEATETANVSEAVLRLALAHPGAHFRLRANGRTLLDLPAHPSMGERVRAALARRGASALHEAAGAEAGVEVRAFLASPEEAASTPRSTFLFVGRRFVRDRSLLHALGMGYGELLEKGRYPLAALFVEVPGQELDINVHPQKLEVRFARAQEVYGAVRHVVAAAVARAPWLAGGAVRAYSLPPWRGEAGERGGAGRPGAGAGGGERLRFHGGATPPAAREVRAPAWPPARAADSPEPPAGPLPGAETLDAWLATESARAADGPPEAAAPPPPSPEVAVAEDAFFARLSYVGQLHRTYLICEGPGELILVDQHAAHERVVFQRLRTAHQQRAVVRQRLLFPIPIEADEVAAASAANPETREMLASLGFEVEPFGAQALLLRAVPGLLEKVDPKPLLLDVLHNLAEGTRPSLAGDRLDHLFATMACHSVVRAGDVLGREQAVALLAQLDAVDLRSHCPHGRPVLLRMSLSDIERRFGRT